MIETRPLYIFDIDGTVADPTHRLHYILNRNPKDWDGFYSECINDPPIRPIIQILHSLEATGAEIWFVTGRKDSKQTRADTLTYLVEHVYAGERDRNDIVLEMRANNDGRDDDIVKLEIYQRMLDIDQQRLVAVFEDRQRVVDMWRAQGIQCLQVAPGDF